jgi:predicted acyl esterase
VSRALLIALLALLTLVPAAAAVPPGAEWSEEYVATPDGESLHLDVLRPAGLPAGARTPVIAVISPYLGHSGGGTAADPTATPGPSTRFDDFLVGAKVFERGWSVVLADLRGSGGSSGCLDILGPGEQADIVTTVEWAAAQPWSTGKVAMYGKSYDGNTGVVGAALRPKGLAAVVAQQVVGDRYRGSYSGGVRYLQSFAYPSVSYGVGAELGFTLQDDPQYTLNSVGHSADCQAGLAGHYDPDPGTDFWTSRDFVAKGAGSTVPFLMTTGFLDANTNIGAGAIDFFGGLAGPKRLWLGWWDHVRGDDRVGDRLAMGRAGWYDEVMRFLDEHVRGIAPAVADPAVVVQGSDGTWRSEAAWPPADAAAHTAPLRAGSYADDGRNLGSNDSAAGPGGTGGVDTTTGAGVWTLSPPLPHDAHLAGIPIARVDAASAGANLAVNLYDVDPAGRATMISRGAGLVADGTTEVAMYPTDWRLPAGHRLGVLVSGANVEAYLHVPTGRTVQVTGGTIELPALRYRRSGDLPGEPAPRLEEFREAAPFDVDPAALEAPAEPALVPPVQTGRPASAPAPAAPGPAAAPRRRALTVRLRARRGVARIRGTAPRDARVTVRLRRGTRVIARRTLVARGGRYAVRIRFSGPRRALSVRVRAADQRARASLGAAALRPARA